MVRTPQHASRVKMTHDQMLNAAKRLRATIDALKEFEPESIADRGDPSVDGLEKRIDETLERAFGPGTSRYERFRGAATLDNGPYTMVMHGRGPPPVDHRRYLREGKASSLALLGEALRTLEEEIEEHTGGTAPIATGSTHSRKVFVVHGRDNEAKIDVARFLGKIGLEEIILHERPNAGRHLLTKFQEEADGASYAVVLITPDDEGGVVGGPQRKRARQNVIFELGFFIGKLGSSHVAALVKGDVETPSDFDGIGYIALDTAGGWKGLLARELKQAGVPFDPAKVFES
jgi:predicted nucleotide-binding protein